MAAIVSLEIFSGRPDPNWSLTGKQQAEFERLIASAPVVARLLGPRDEPLGYRGFRVHIDHAGAAPSDLKIYDGWISGGQTREDSGRAIERWLLDTAGSSIPNDLAAYVRSEIDASP